MSTPPGPPSDPPPPPAAVPPSGVEPPPDPLPPAAAALAPPEAEDANEADEAVPEPLRWADDLLRHTPPRRVKTDRLLAAAQAQVDAEEEAGLGPIEEPLGWADEQLRHPPPPRVNLAKLLAAAAAQVQAEDEAGLEPPAEPLLWADEQLRHPPPSVVPTDRLLRNALAQVELEERRGPSGREASVTRLQRWRGPALTLCAAAAVILIFRAQGPNNTGSGAGGGAGTERATCPGFPAPRESDPAASPDDQKAIATTRQLAAQEMHDGLALVTTGLRSYPASPFEAERQALEIHLLFCGSSEDAAAARTKAKAFLGRVPQGPWADQVRRDLASPPKAVPW